VTHRLHEATPTGLKTKGDANRTPDPWTLPERNVVGAVVAGLPYGGYLLVFLQQPTGVPALMVLTVTIVLAWSIFFGAPAEPVRPSAPRVPKQSAVAA
jgi:signal peptidase